MPNVGNPLNELQSSDTNACGQRHIIGGRQHDVSDSDDTCPRCGGGFHCGVSDAAPCACTTLTLSDALLADLRARYGARCLCLRCLAELAAQEKSRPV